MDRKETEAPALRFGSTAGRDRLDDISLKRDDFTGKSIKSQSLPRQAGAGRMTILWEFDEKHPRQVVI
jgi:hypothetical protein